MNSGDRNSRTLGKPANKDRSLLLQHQIDAHAGSATTGRRKPVPTPRNTLKKQVAAMSPATPTTTRRDSQGQASLDSTSPEETTTSNENGASSTNGGTKAEVEGGEDILAALEKIPGVGSLRSVAAQSPGSSSIGSSLPSLNNDKVVKREEESSHSLGSAAQLSDGAMSSHNKRRFHTTARSSISGSTTTGSGSVSASATTTSAEESSAANSPLRLKCSIQEEEDETDESKENDANIKTDDGDDEMNRSMVQTRPLPDLPKNSPKSHDEISVVSSTATNERVYSTLLSPDHYSELAPPLLPPQSQPPPKRISVLPPLPTTTSETASLLCHDANRLTMTGTMRKGAKGGKGVKESVYDIQMSLTREQIAQIEKKVHDKHHDRCFCGCARGIHVLAFTLFCLPFALLACTLSGFYLGTLTWYNVFLHYNEERTCCHKLLSPFVLLAYPLWIVPVTLGLGVFGGLAQISWYFDSWLKAVKAPDGGFLGWACDKMGVPECAPYQVVLLTAQEELVRPRCGGTTRGIVADL